MKREVKIINAFPIPIWVFDDIEITDELYEFCINADFTQKKSKFSKTNWHSEWFYPSTCDKKFDIFLKTITNCASVCAESVDALGKIHLSNFWININNKNDSDEYHSHSDTFLSGVYYVKSPEKGGNFSILPPNQLMTYWWGNYTDNENKMNNYNCPLLSIPPIEKRLLIFPSFLLHGVEENITNESRVSVAFNFNISHNT